MKRGQSNIIAVVLFIVLVLIAIVVVWNVVKKTVTEKTEGIDIEIMTTDVTIGKASVHINETENKLQLSVTRGANKAELSSMKIVVLGKEDSKMYIIPDYPEALETKTYVLNISGLSNITKISVYPVSAKGKIGIEEEYDVTGKEPEEIDETLSPTNPKSESGGCASEYAGVTCGSWICGNKINNCGNNVSCGTCGGGYECNITTGQCVPSCIYGNWINQGCGERSCLATQMYQNKSVINGTGCTEIKQCVDDAICTLYPLIIFGAGTETDGSTITRDNIFINVSATGKDSNISTFIDFDNSLVSWWRMDDVNSSGDLTDYLGRNNGSKQGNAIQTASGALGKGFAFDGAGDYINLGNTASLKIATKTISFWANPASQTTRYTHLIVICAGASNYYLSFYDLAGNKYVYYRWVNSSGSAKIALSNTGVVVENQWHNYALVVNVSGTTVNFTFYRDGLIVGSSQNTEGYSTTYGSNFVLGAYSSASDFFNGTLDDIMVFNRSLSAAEIAALYANTSSKYLFRNFTGLTNKIYTFRAYAQDLGGNVSSTETRSVTVFKT